MSARNSSVLAVVLVLICVAVFAKDKDQPVGKWVHFKVQQTKDGAVIQIEIDDVVLTVPKANMKHKNGNATIEITTKKGQFFLNDKRDNLGGDFSIDSKFQAKEIEDLEAFVKDLR